LDFTFVDPTPAEVRELFDIIKVDAQRASITVKKDLLDTWGEYTLTVMVSADLKRKFLDETCA
jgi:hypothetical protein